LLMSACRNGAIGSAFAAAPLRLKRTIAWRATFGVSIGTFLGAFAVTDASGRFELLGIRSGAIAVRASKDGYVPQTRRPVSDSILFDDMG
jgi:hypothetical protein